MIRCFSVRLEIGLQGFEFKLMNEPNGACLGLDQSKNSQPEIETWTEFSKKNDWGKDSLFMDQTHPLHPGQPLGLPVPLRSFLSPHQLISSLSSSSSSPNLSHSLKYLVKRSSAILYQWSEVKSNLRIWADWKCCQPTVPEPCTVPVQQVPVSVCLK